MRCIGKAATRLPRDGVCPESIGMHCGVAQRRGDPVQTHARRIGIVRGVSLSIGFRGNGAVPVDLSGDVVHGIGDGLHGPVMPLVGGGIAIGVGDRGKVAVIVVGVVCFHAIFDFPPDFTVAVIVEGTIYPWYSFSTGRFVLLLSN